MSPTPPLNYAPPPPLHRRKSFRRLLTAGFLLLIAIAASFWAPQAWRHVQLLYWQHRCMVYTAPPDQVVYDSATDGFIPPPSEWSKFYNLYSPPGFNSRGTAFLHQMQQTDGKLRLVAVDVELLAFNTNHHLLLYPRVIVPLNFLSSPAEPNWGSGKCETLPDDGAPAFKIFAGQIDPSDPSHFTIRMQQNNHQFYFDGWLQNDQLTIDKRTSPEPAK